MKISDNVKLCFVIPAKKPQKTLILALYIYILLLTCIYNWHIMTIIVFSLELI